jgi:hypothetical protein
LIGLGVEMRDFCAAWGMTREHSSSGCAHSVVGFDFWLAQDHRLVGDLCWFGPISSGSSGSGVAPWSISPPAS